MFKVKRNIEPSRLHALHASDNHPPLPSESMEAASLLLWLTPLALLQEAVLGDHGAGQITSCRHWCVQEAHAAQCISPSALRPFFSILYHAYPGRGSCAWQAWSRSPSYAPARQSKAGQRSCSASPPNTSHLQLSVTPYPDLAFSSRIRHQGS